MYKTLVGATQRRALLRYQIDEMKILHIYIYLSGKRTAGSISCPKL